MIEKRFRGEGSKEIDQGMTLIKGRERHQEMAKDCALWKRERRKILRSDCGQSIMRIWHMMTMKSEGNEVGGRGVGPVAK